MSAESLAPRLLDRGSPEPSQSTLTLDGRNRFHFNQEVLLYKAINHHQRVRWIRLIAEEVWKQRLPLGHEMPDVLAVREVCRKFDDLAVIGSHAAQHVAQITEHLPELRLEVALADHLALAAHRKLTGYKCQGPALHESNM